MTRTWWNGATLGLTRAWLVVWGLVGIASSCLPQTEVIETGAAGDAGANESSAGKGGGPGQGASGGRGGAVGAGGSGAKGGTIGRGGSGKGGASSGGATAVGGSTALGGSTGSGKGGAGGSPGGAGDGALAGTMAVGGEAGETAQGGMGGGEAGPTEEELLDETIVRWNLVADARPPNDYEFHWVKLMFPHPTFKMGTPEGYHEFAFVLVEFLDAGDNFAFLAENHLFRMGLDYGTASSADVDPQWTFEELAQDFSTMDYGDIPEDVQSRLAELAAQM